MPGYTPWVGRHARLYTPGYIEKCTGLYTPGYIGRYTPWVYQPPCYTLGIPTIPLPGMTELATWTTVTGVTGRRPWAQRREKDMGEAHCSCQKC